MNAKSYIKNLALGIFISPNVSNVLHIPLIMNKCLFSQSNRLIITQNIFVYLNNKSNLTISHERIGLTCIQLNTSFQNVCTKLALRKQVINCFYLQMPYI